MSRRTYRGAAAIIATLAIVATACSDNKSSSSTSKTTAGSNATAGNTASAPGITTDSITVGFVSSETGVASANNKGAAAFKARIQALNDKGGIFGRTIKVVSEDDTSAPNGNLTAVQKIVQQNNPFVMVDESAFTFAGYRYLVEQKIPSITGGYDGPQYADAGNEYLLPLSGNVGKGFPTSTITPQLMKDQGVVKGAGLGYGISPSSANAAKRFAEQGLPAVGLGKGYLNTSIPFGGENVGPIILDMKKQGVNGAYLAMDNNTNFAIANSAIQNGLDLKALVMATGYDQSLLDNPTTVATAEKGHVFIGAAFAPYDSGNAGTNRMQAVFKKYLSLDGVPTFGFYEGYATAQLLIDGLKAAGRNPTRQGYVDAVRSFDSYDVDGMACSGVSFTMETYGKVDTKKESCQYFVKVEGGKFVATDKVTGHLIDPGA
jgi:ABC-type branched-subunit amino acid transport system substrate-binding protein